MMETEFSLMDLYELIDAEEGDASVIREEMENPIIGVMANRDFEEIGLDDDNKKVIAGVLDDWMESQKLFLRNDDKSLIKQVIFKLMMKHQKNIEQSDEDIINNYYELLSDAGKRQFNRELWFEYISQEKECFARMLQGKENNNLNNNNTKQSLDSEEEGVAVCGICMDKDPNFETPCCKQKALCVSCWDKCLKEKWECSYCRADDF